LKIKVEKDSLFSPETESYIKEMVVKNDLKMFFGSVLMTKKKVNCQERNFLEKLLID